MAPIAGVVGAVGVVGVVGVEGVVGVIGVVGVVFATTVTFTSWLTDRPAAFVAINSKVCVLLRVPVREDVAATSTPSKRTLVALETLHLSVHVSPAVIVVGLALK